MKIPNPITGEISLYFHIPFCRKKCPYCHFFVIQNTHDKQKLLFNALLEEIDQKRHFLKNKTIVSIYFGGGTPFLFSLPYLQSILKKIFSQKVMIATNCEITIEANPEDITKEKILALKDMGFNRLSLGTQSFDDFLLKKIGRSHEKKKIFQSLSIIEKCGLSNVSIDLMYDLPGQTLLSWEKTLSYIPHLPISHLSLYNLTIEPNTVFFKKKERLKALLPSNEESFSMLEKALSFFEKISLKRYEISAFARCGAYSKHNVGYWMYRPFLGFGPSAFSYFHQRRYQNIANFPKYLEAILSKRQVNLVDHLKQSEQIKEALLVQLRLIQGVDLKIFETTWGKIPGKTLHTIDHLSKLGYLTCHKNILRLTDKGLLFYDSIAVEML